jgi:hypothetical protein
VIAKDRVITVVEDFKRGVFTMALRRGDALDLRLYALPSTIRARFSTDSAKAAFEAMFLEGDISVTASPSGCVAPTITQFDEAQQGATINGGCRLARFDPRSVVPIQETQ